MVDVDKPNTAVAQGSDLMGEVRTRADARGISDLAALIDVTGDVTAVSEPVLMSAYEKAITQSAGRLVPNLGGLEYMNSGDIRILVTLLIRANRQHKKLRAYGLSDHYREIFELTRLDEAITIYDSEQTALIGTASLRSRHDRAYGA
jgi:anti-sigma B factor antagonist